METFLLKIIADEHGFQSAFHFPSIESWCQKHNLTVEEFFNKLHDDCCAKYGDWKNTQSGKWRKAADGHLYYNY